MLLDKHISDIMQIPGLINKDELEYLCQIAQSTMSWTEIGTYCGRSFYAVGIHLPKKALIQVIDNNLGTIYRGNQTFLTTYTQLVQVRPDLKIVMHRMQSQYCKDIACNTEVVFIDGNHTYEHVKADISIWSKKAKLLLGHDYNYPGYPDIKRAVDEAKLSPTFKGFQVNHTIWRLEPTT